MLGLRTCALALVDLCTKQTEPQTKCSRSISRKQGKQQAARTAANSREHADATNFEFRAVKGCERTCDLGQTTTTTAATTAAANAKAEVEAESFSMLFLLQLAEAWKKKGTTGDITTGEAWTWAWDWD